jgi:hypothetical protein
MEQKWVNNLNNDEFNLIDNDWYPIIKKSAIDKIKSQLIEEGAKLQKVYPRESYKISAGEKLNNLPYVVLDFPRIEGPKFNFVCRALFWWGRGIQFQLILNGKSNEVYAKILAQSMSSDFVLLGQNLWENDIETAHFCELNSMSEFQKELVLQANFFKLIRFKPFQLNERFFEDFTLFYQFYAKLVD